jgi:hypothetical protein
VLVGVDSVMVDSEPTPTPTGSRRSSPRPNATLPPGSSRREVGPKMRAATRFSAGAGGWPSSPPRRWRRPRCAPRATTTRRSAPDRADARPRGRHGVNVAIRCSRHLRGLGRTAVPSGDARGRRCRLASAAMGTGQREILRERGVDRRGR